jgi:hypothetical protein
VKNGLQLAPHQRQSRFSRQTVAVTLVPIEMTAFSLSGPWLFDDNLENEISVASRTLDRSGSCSQYATP